MITISSKVHHGVSAMFELAKRYNQGPVQIRYISELHGIPQKYLEQVLISLKQAGLLKSFRGSQGGYVLSRAPHLIPINDIWRCLSGTDTLSKDVQESALGFYWIELQSSVYTLLSLSLAELLEKQVQQANIVMYSI